MYNPYCSTGGIRSAKESLSWLSLMKEELGSEWTHPKLFRMGASSLLGDIERQLYHQVTGRYAAIHQMPILECVYTHWTSWNSCHTPSNIIQVSESLQIPQNCVTQIQQRVRTRDLIFFEESDVPCPHLSETELCRSEVAERCLRDSLSHYATSIDLFHWRVGTWGECHQLIGQECGVGLQTRNVSCFDRSFNQLNHSLCNKSEPISSRICHFSCKCQMFPWSHWSTCLSSSCDKPSGERSRFRSVARQPTYGSCPSLWQRGECSKNVTCQSAVYKWSIASDWSECYEGLSSRLVLCLLQNRTETYLSDNSKCDNISRPLSHLFCTSEGVLGDWVQWSRCEDNCPSLRKRIRQLFSGSTSSDLIQYSVCNTCQYNTFLCYYYNTTAGNFYSKICNYTESSDVILSPWSDWSVCRDNSTSRTRDLIGYYNSVIPDNIPLRFSQQQSCHEITHSWRVSDWSDCYLSSNALCFYGYQNRSVECLDSNRFPSQFCDILDKPPNNRTCRSECCRYSDWSVYSQCSAVCGIGTKIRKRMVLSSNCDQSIGSIQTSEGQCNTIPCLPSYHWHVKEFGDCIPLTQHSSCGEGYRTAGIECVSESGLVVPDRNCGSSRLPPSEDLVSTCTLPCPHCYLTQWTPYSPCLLSCTPSIRQRYRQLIGSDCSSVNVNLAESAPCPLTSCPSYRWGVVSRWSSCLPLNGSCGRGMNHRAISCLRSDGTPFSDSYCTDTPPPIQKECAVLCPTDCVTGIWTQWTHCSVTCNGGVRFRSRPVVSHPQLGGQECSPLLERSPCSPKACPFPQWVSTPWTPCVYQSNIATVCGFGIQHRTVDCLVGVNISNSCSLISKPPLDKRCYIPCPSDCIHTDWGQWASCTSGYRQRTRSILRGRNGTGLSCGATIESESCLPPGVKWIYSDYSSCSHSQSLCGTGTQYRNYTCATNEGILTFSHLCMNQLGPPSDVTRFCNLSCPIKCSVSEFSSWSICSGSCANPSGVQTRVRFVTSPPQNGGTICPPQEETRPCYLSHCPHPIIYRGPWSSCQTSSRTCGTGQMVRSVLCLNKFGSSLPLSSCLPDRDLYSPLIRLDTDTRTYSACAISCPDIILPNPLQINQSNCTSLCSNTSRSLSIRPYPLSYFLPGGDTHPGDSTPEYRTHKCAPSPDTCLKLEWQTSDWLGGQRDVSCIARGSGGVIQLSSGCDYETKPSNSSISCLNCSENSHCSDLTGECVCNRDHIFIANKCVKSCVRKCLANQLCDISTQECVYIPQTPNTTITTNITTEHAIAYSNYLLLGLIVALFMMCLIFTLLIIIISLISLIIFCYVAVRSSGRILLRKSQISSCTPSHSSRCVSCSSQPPAYSSQEVLSPRGQLSISPVCHYYSAPNLSSSADMC
ncbi:Thrombospondin type-1 domain-containing protein 7B-like [Oopsacas minuta]|uniref:Thrombospondin type-1 domain-containing protein 7B-like n=1 Tax=Oopsacas minuta TaxID=111878 RepID=A0AAV7K9R4_9METZ|nr:Thrombospondin type-1 domain-containing protein 7B-like [Oopsacas minuta]